MRKEIIQTGKTVEEARASACLILGVELQDSELEIIDLPKTTFFGLKKIPAKVRVWIDLPEEEVKAPARKEHPTNPIKTEKPAPIEKKVSERKTFESQASVSAEPVVLKEAPSADFAHKAVIAEDYIRTIMAGMNVEGEVSSHWQEDGLYIGIIGKGLGALIGRKGETLTSIQYLTSLVVNRLEGEYLRVTVDCGDYRLKRNKDLIDIAKKAADQVLKTNVSRALEVMNPAERRVVHSAISEMEGVSSISVGNDPYRRVMIKTPTSKSKPDSRGGDRRRTGTGNGRPPRRDMKDRAPRSATPREPEIKESPVVSPVETKETKSDTPLYGKIDLD